MVVTQCENCGADVRRGGSKPGRFCSNTCKSEWHKANSGSIDREWLHQKYVVERLDCTQIGSIVGKDPSTVHWYLERYAIPRRGRGYGKPSNHFQKGHAMRLGIRHTDEARLKISQKGKGKKIVFKSGQHWLKGQPASANPNWKGGITPERQELYRSEEWKQAVKVVWKRDNATCQRCKMHMKQARVIGVSFDIHHITSFANRELRCEPDNLVLLCEPCHYWVHSKLNVNKEFIRG